MFQKLKSFLFENKTSGQTVAKNSVWLSISNFGGRVIKAVVVIYGARVLGASEWGIFSYATTLAAFFTLFVDPGLNAIIMRDSGKSEEDQRRMLFSTAFIFKLALLAVGVAIIVFIAPFFTTLPGAKELLPIAALIIVFDTLREAFSAFIRSMEKMEWEAGIYLLTNVAIVVFGLTFLMIKPDAVSFGWGYVLGSAIGAIIAVFVLRGYMKRIFSSFSSKIILPIMRSAWPFAVVGALGFLLTSLDILVISWMRTATDVGVYSAGVRIIQVLYLIPMIIQYSTLPLFARLARKDDERFRSAFERVISTIFLASIPLALGGAILGTQIMTFVFGASFAAGGLAFRILMLTMIVDFPAMVISNAIFAYDHQRSLIVSSAIGSGLNVIFDVILIPIFGIAGSSVATLIAQAASNWYLWRTMNKLNKFSVFPHLPKIILAGGMMALAAIIMAFAGVQVLVNIAICILVYFGILYFMREPLLVNVKNILGLNRGTPSEGAAA